MTTKKYQVPFDPDGNLIRQFQPFWRADIKARVNFIDNFEFQDILKYSALHRSQSSVYAIFISHTTGKRYYMFAKDLDNVLQNHTIKIGFLSGTFTFRKHGRSYGIKIISSDRLAAIS